jgi:transposase-like protein
MIAQLKQIPSEAKINALLRKILYGKNMSCPWCHKRKIQASENRYWCTLCRKHFSLLSGTWLAGMKLNLRTWYTLLWCWTQKIPVLQSQRVCHVSEETVRLWFRQFRLHLPAFEPILEGCVQMDEAYFRNISLVLAKQVGSRKLAHQILRRNSVNKSDVAEFLFQWIAPRTRLQTDGGGMYKQIQRHWQVRHRVDIHRKFEFGLTSEIEGMFGNLRTFIRRMYHHTTPEYLPEYVSEFCYRFSSPEIFSSPNDYLAVSLKPVPFD